MLGSSKSVAMLNVANEFTVCIASDALLKTLAQLASELCGLLVERGDQNSSTFIQKSRAYSRCNQHMSDTQMKFRTPDSNYIR